MATGEMEKWVSFVVGQYKKNPNLSMSQLRKLGKPHGVKVYPVIIGKAKTRLGMSKAKPAAGMKRGPGRPPKAAAAPTVKRGPGRPPKPAMVVAPVRRGPGRPPKVASHSGHGVDGAVATLGDVAALVKRLEADLARAHGKLAQIASVAGG